MRTALKWIALSLGSLLIILVLVGAVIFARGQSALARSDQVTPDAVAIPDDDEARARGQHLVEAVVSCGGCHGEDLGGAPFMDDPSFAVLPAPNLTAGQGGIGATYTDADWIRALRQGVAADGRALMVMPSHWYYYLTDEDLGALIAYLKALPPVDSNLPARQISLLPKLLVGIGAFKLEPAWIAQNGPRTEVTPEASAAYGEYISRIAVCRDCHGSNLAGAENPNAPAGSNITPGGSFAAYREEDFFTLMRTGITPGGSQVSDEMPWGYYQSMTDTELRALFSYLQSLEPLSTNGS
ncbi:MAG: cytochrome c [Caldilineaceae bacterium]|nr:cytochrome c [Caldilineaceae bacterium]